MFSANSLVNLKKLHGRFEFISKLKFSSRVYSKKTANALDCEKFVIVLVRVVL